MGTITRSFANNLTTGGVLKADAFNNASLNNVTALNAAIATGNMVLLSSQTASSSASIEFTTGIDSTYKEYQFYFINIHPQNSNIQFQVNFSTDGGSNYNVTKTSTFFRSIHAENDTFSGLGYRTDEDLAQSTSDQILMYALDNDSDANANGCLQLFNPSSTTYVKHFISNCSGSANDGATTKFDIGYFCAGYGNTTSAINAVRFQMSSGNIDDGTILMYGIN
jgi:hypothetical protein